MRSMSSKALVAGLLGAILASGCRGPAREDGWSVAVSIAPQRWLVREIGGPRVGVVLLVRSGESPAVYQPTDRQVTRVMGSRLYFRIGVPFENGPWFRAIADRGGPPRIVDLRRGVHLRPMDGTGAGRPAGGEGLDPHIWLDPRLLSIQAETVAEALAATDPDHAADYRDRLADLKRRLEEADAEIRRILSPFRGRRVYVYHPAWGYFCAAYGLRQVPIQVEGKDPADRELTEVIERARGDRVRAIFVQKQVSGEAARAVARAVGARLVTLDPLAEDVPANLLAVARSFAEALR